MGGDMRGQNGNEVVSSPDDQENVNMLPYDV